MAAGTSRRRPLGTSATTSTTPRKTACRTTGSSVSKTATRASRSRPSGRSRRRTGTRRTSRRWRYWPRKRRLFWRPSPSRWAQSGADGNQVREAARARQGVRAVEEAQGAGRQAIKRRRSTARGPKKQEPEDNRWRPCEAAQGASRQASEEEGRAEEAIEWRRRPRPRPRRARSARQTAPQGEGAAEAPRRRQARQGGPRGAHGRRRLDQGGEAATRHDACRQIFCAARRRQEAAIRA